MAHTNTNVRTERITDRRVVMRLFSTWLSAPNRRRCTWRALPTCSRIAALDVPSALADSSWNGTAGTSMCMSMRSSSGPLMRPM